MFCLEDFFIYVLKYFFNGISKYLVNEVNALPARSFIYADKTDNYKERVLDILHKKCISCPKLFLFIAISSIIFLNIFDRR